MRKKDLHKDVFLRNITYKPLLINIKTDVQPHTFYDAMRDPQKAIENAENAFKNI